MSSKVERRTHKRNTIKQQGLEMWSETILKSKAKVSGSGNDVTFH